MFFTCPECSETLNVAYFTCLEGSARLNLLCVCCVSVVCLLCAILGKKRGITALVVLVMGAVVIIYELPPLPPTHRGIV